MERFDVLNLREKYELSDTEAFRLASDLCYESGGGEIYVPKGRYTIASVRLYSNTYLHMDKEAEIYSDPREESYGDLRGKYDTYYTRDSSELLGIPKGQPLQYLESLILCNLRRKTDCMFYIGEAENVTVEGGILDGQYRYFFDIKDENQTERFGVHVFRLQMIVAYGSRNLTFRNIKIRGCSCFNMRILQSEGIHCDGVDIEADRRCLNTDGMNFASSRDILVENCSFSVGDDCIAFSTGEVSPLEGDCENALVRNCVCKTNTELVRVFTGIELDVGIIAGMRFSKELDHARSQTCRNITVENCTLASGGSAVNIIGSFGNIENIRVKGINGKADNKHPAIFIITQREATIRGVSIEDIDFTGNGVASIQGVNKDSVTDVRISNCRFNCTPCKKRYYHELPDPLPEYWVAGEAPCNIFVRHATDIRLEDCRVTWQESDCKEPFPAALVSDTDGFSAKGLDASGYLCNTVIEHK